MTRFDYNKKLCSYATYFTYSEFMCNCGKCSSPAYLNPKLITYLDEMRKHFGKPIIVTSGLRCRKYNSSLKGSATNSRHLTGNAADVYIKGVDPSQIVRYWKSLNIGYSYCGTSNMGNSAHVQIGW